MAFMFKKVAQEVRDQLELHRGKEFLRTHKHTQKFLNEVLDPERRVDVEEAGLCRIKLDKSTNEIEFRGFEVEILARPEYICQNNEWIAKILFYRIRRPVVGDPSTEPVYEIQINNRGDLTCGAGAEHYDLHGADADDMWHFRKRILLDLLAVIESGPPPKA